MLGVHFLDEDEEWSTAWLSSPWRQTLHANRTDQWGDWSDLSNLDVDPNYMKKQVFLQMWTFEDKGDDLPTKSLSDKLRMVRWHEHSSDIVPISGSKQLV